MNEYGFFSKDVALKLDINASTLRQWCLAIEKEGYEIERNDKQQRIFYDRDINLLFEIKLQIEKTRERDNAIKSIVSRFKNQNNAQNPPSVSENKGDIMTLEQGKEILKRLDQQEQFNKLLLEQLDKQQKFIEESLTRRDQQLIESLRESQETRKLIAAATEKAEQQQEKKSWFKSLFNKKRNDN